MDDELLRMIAAYEHIKGMNRAQWTRTLEYISKRMAEDDRAARWVKETEAPVAYIAAGNWDERADTADEVATDLAVTDSILEVNGVAIVSQKFCFRILIGDIKGEIDGDEILWFDTREAAEKYLAGMTKDLNSGHGEPAKRPTVTQTFGADSAEEAEEFVRQSTKDL